MSAFLFYCLLLNHSFQTNPNSVTNCFKLFSLLQLYNYIAPAFPLFWFLNSYVLHFTIVRHVAGWNSGNLSGSDIERIESCHVGSFIGMEHYVEHRGRIGCCFQKYLFRFFNPKIARTRKVCTKLKSAREWSTVVIVIVIFIT